MRSSPDVLLALVTALALPVLALASCGSGDRPAPAGAARSLAPTVLAPTVLASSPASPPASPSPELPAAVSDCVHAELRPRAITVACGDGGVVLRELSFDRWDARGASGRGTELRDSCVPDCAHGREVALPVQVELSQPQRVFGRPVFTRLVLRTAQGRPMLDTPLLPLSCSVTPPSCPASPPPGS